MESDQTEYIGVDDVLGEACAQPIVYSFNNQNLQRSEITCFQSLCRVRCIMNIPKGELNLRCRSMSR